MKKKEEGLIEHLKWLNRKMADGVFDEGTSWGQKLKESLDGYSKTKPGKIISSIERKRTRKRAVA